MMEGTYWWWSWWNYWSSSTVTLTWNPNTKASAKYSYYPPGLYYGMYKVACENNVSIKEVETVFIRKMLETTTGFVCKHPEDKVKVKNGKAYCGFCRTRLTILKERSMQQVKGLRTVVRSGIYEEQKTFLEKEEAIDPRSSLLPDYRGSQ
jgi:hypothetical protein